MRIVATSSDTGVAQRNEHLRSNDFKVTRDLTVKAVTRPISLDVEYTGTAVDPMGNNRIGFEATTTINRRDWGITWNAPLEAGGVLVSVKITLDIDVSAIKRQSAG